MSAPLMLANLASLFPSPAPTARRSERICAPSHRRGRAPGAPPTAPGRCAIPPASNAASRAASSMSTRRGGPPRPHVSDPGSPPRPRPRSGNPVVPVARGDERLFLAGRGARADMARVVSRHFLSTCCSHAALTICACSSDTLLKLTSGTTSALETTVVMNGRQLSLSSLERHDGHANARHSTSAKGFRARSPPRAREGVA